MKDASVEIGSLIGAIRKKTPKPQNPKSVLLHECLADEFAISSSFGEYHMGEDVFVEVERLNLVQLERKAPIL